MLRSLISSTVTPLEAPSVRSKEKPTTTSKKNLSPPNEAPVRYSTASTIDSPKKRGRPSNAELAERAKATRDAENRLKDSVEEAAKIIKADPTAAGTLETVASMSPTGFFFRSGNLVKTQNAAGEWRDGIVIRHPVDMPDMVRVLWDNGNQAWHAAKNLSFLR